MSRDIKFLIEDLGLNFSIGSNFAFESNDLERLYKWKFKFVSNEKYFCASCVVANKYGFSIINENSALQITYAPVGWVEHACNKLNDWKLFDLEALGYMKEFQMHSQQISAEITVRHLKQGTITLKYIQDNAPDLKEHPLVKEALKELLESGLLAKSSRGQPKRNSQCDLAQHKAELVFRVILYRQEGITQKEAIIRTLRENESKIPAGWKEDPEENLKKEVQRLSEHPIFKDVGRQTVSYLRDSFTVKPVPWKKSVKK